MAINSTSLTLGPANIYVSSGTSVVSVMYFCNQNSAAANLNLWAVGNGSVAGGGVTSANLIYKEILIAAADTFVVDMEKLALSNGDYIVANAGATVNATVSSLGI